MYQLQPLTAYRTSGIGFVSLSLFHDVMFTGPILCNSYTLVIATVSPWVQLPYYACNTAFRNTLPYHGLLYFFFPLFFSMLWAWERVLDVLFEAEYSIVVYYQYFDQLWVASVITSIHCQEEVSVSRANSNNNQRT